MRPFIAMLGAVICVAGACATSPERSDDELAKALAGRMPGTTVSCIDGQRVDGPEVIDAHVILYREVGRIWRSDLPAACPGLHDDSRLIVELHGSHICQNDQFRPIDPGEAIPGPYCRFGKFTAWDKPKR